MEGNQLEQIESIVDLLLNNVESINNCQKEDLKEVIFNVTQMLLESAPDSLKNKAITLLYLITIADKLSLKESWVIFWVIQEKLCNRDLHLLSGDIRTLYAHLLELIRKRQKKSYKYIKPEERNQNVIVVIISQYMGTENAPSLRMLDYSYTFQKLLNKDVVIINDGVFNLHRYNYINSYEFNFIKELIGGSYLKYKDTVLSYYQNNIKMPDITRIFEIVQMVYELNPMYVYNIGGTSFVADLCTQFTATASLPCSLDLPITGSKYLLLGRKLEKRDDIILENLESYQTVIETEINYMKKECAVVYSREQFGLHKEQFVVAVVGNRLQSEINEYLVKVINKITILENVVVVFIGEI